MADARASSSDSALVHAGREKKPPVGRPFFPSVSPIPMRPEGLAAPKGESLGLRLKRSYGVTLRAEGFTRPRVGVLKRTHQKRCTGSPAAASGAGTPVGWYMGRQWETLIGVPIRPIRPRVASNAITPRPIANLVLPPLLVVLGLPVVAPNHTEQISHGPLNFQGQHGNTADICQLSIPSGFRHRQRADGLRTSGRFSRRLQLDPGLTPPTSWSLPRAGPTIQ
jgi:hypothetical protein